MTHDLLLWLALLAAVVSLAPLFMLRALVSSPTTWTVGVMAAPLVLAALAVLAAGPRSWRADPRSRLTAEDVRAMGLDPAEHGFVEGRRWRGAVLTFVAVAAPVAAPALVLAANRLT